jgi:acetyl esterase
MRAVMLLFGALVGCLAAPAQPAEFPGADAHVYRADPELRLHVVRPASDAGKARPAFLFFFGGGWTRGTPQNSIGWARLAAQWGMVGIAPDYRTKDRFGTSPLEAVADARAALRWVQDHAAELGVDPAKIVVGGNSAGGHLALWTALKTVPPGSTAEESPREPPAALILMSTVSDTSRLSGYTPARFGAHATALSPLHQLDARMPPVLAFHGDADRTVPHSQAVALDARLREAGNTSELVTVPGGSHSFANELPEWRERARTRIREYLAAQGLAEPAR